VDVEKHFRAYDDQIHGGVMSNKIAIALAIVLAAKMASAHHSDSRFDVDRVVAFEGTVEKFAWKNPHVYLTIRDANEVEWIIETGPTPIMNRSGWTRDSFAPGDIVSVRSNPDRNPKKKHGLLLSIEGPDGIVRSSRQRNSESDIPATGATTTSLSGVWAGENSHRSALWTALADHPLTPKGYAATVEYDESMHPTVNCDAPPSPWIIALADIYLVEFQIGEREIVFRSEFNDAERIVYIDGRGHPEDGERTIQGHSIGTWEGDTLVVDTTLFADNRSPFPGLGLPSGKEKHIVEHFTLTEDGTRLLIDILMDDSEYMAEPIKSDLVWHYSPHLNLLKFDCDPGVAQQFLN
jgi:hypothetical protein